MTRMVRAEHAPSARRGTATSVLSTVLSAFPVFVLGSLAPLLAGDIGLPGSAVGSVVAAFFLASAVTSVHGGRLSEWFGWSRVVLLGGLATALASAVGAVVVQRPLHLGVFAAILGAANGLTQPAATEVLSAAVPPARQGPAFGAKHAAVPAASLLAGLSIPTMALTVGWRWTYAVVGVLIVPLALIVPWSSAPRARVRPSRGRRAAAFDRKLVLTSVGAGLITAAANALAAYLVVAAVAGGMDLGPAGLLLSACSVACIATRLLSGYLPDGRRGYLPTVIALVAAGCLGYVLLATSAASSVPFTVGAILAFAGGWGWSAVLGLGVVRDNPSSPAAATGVLHAGTFAGGVAGPVIFGAVVAVFSYTVAWSFAAALTLAGLGCFLRVLAGGTGPSTSLASRDPGCPDRDP